MSTGPIELAIVGAGPQALALVAALVARDPRWRDGLVVLDPSGGWLTGWRHRFDSHEITTLRSAAVHHPHPDPHALHRHAREQDRTAELAPPYDQPTAALFDDFCDRLVADTGPAEGVRRARVQRIVPRGRGVGLVLDGADDLEVARVVLATNPVRRQVPGEAALVGSPAWCHSDDVDLRRLQRCEGRRIDVVGGGLTALQLACGAARRGATVRLRSRRPLVRRSFDVEPGWLGPRNLRRFGRCRHPARRRLIDEARGGGSVPSQDLAVLRATTVEPCVSAGAVADALGSDADTVWFATGGRVDVGADPLLGDLRSAFPTPIHDGLPQLGADLSWPGAPIHLMGSYAALELGPAARNLWGARFAAARIADAIEAS